jgi:outer membrane protein OmpA-like peptidoglycan-associated protein
MRILFTISVSLLFFVSSRGQHLFIQHPHPKGFLDKVHFNPSFNHCKMMGAYNAHRTHKTHKKHIPHTISLVHVVPYVPHAASSPRADSNATASTNSAPLVVKEPTEEEKVAEKLKSNPKIAKYEQAVAALKSGESLPLPSINFVYNQNELAVANMESFMEAVEFANNGFLVLIEGHTDDKGSDEYNLKLSMKRVERIKQLMVDMGVSDDNISVVGHGERQPLVPNDSDANRLKNRRIEFKVFKL